MLKDFIDLARPKQWTKNLILFAGIIFSNNLLHPKLLLSASIAFLLFCFLSSAIYAFNDVMDMEKDRNHPLKKTRPLPSGRISKKQALVFSALVLIAAFGLLFFYSNAFRIIALSYLILVLVYSLKLKEVPILDVIIISIGFVLRALAGGVIIPAAPISAWLLLCAFLLALVLGFGKRRHELVLLGNDSSSHRKILVEYSPELLDSMILIAASCTLMAYSLYTFSATHSKYMMVTIPFVAFGIFRYLYLVHIKGEGGSPESILLHDSPMIITILLWGIIAILILRFEALGYLGKFLE